MSPFDDVAEMNAAVKAMKKVDLKPKPGERWRVTFEGEVTHVSGRYIDIGDVGCLATDEGVWERLPDPEPEWKPGDLVIDAKDDIYRRLDTDWQWSHPWRRIRDGAHCEESVPDRPLTRLVREK